MNFKEFIELLRKNNQEIKKLSDSEKLEDIKTRSTLLFKNSNAKRVFFDNLFKDITSDEFINDVIPSLDKDISRKFVAKFVEYLSKPIPLEFRDSRLGDKMFNLISDKSLDAKGLLDEALKILDEASEKYPEKKELVLKKGITVSQKMFFNAFKTDEDLELFSKIYSGINEKKLEASIPDFSQFPVPEEVPGCDLIYKKEAEINEIISSLDPNKDKETIEILKDCNEIATKAKSEYYDMTSDVAEKYGVVVDDQVVVDLIQDYLDQGYKESEISQSKRHAYLNKGEAKAGELDPIFKDAKIFNPKKDEETALNDIIKDMIDWEIYTPGEFEAESKTKIYGFESLIKAKEKLEKAIDSKDIEKIKLYHEKYKDLEAKYDNIIERLEKINDNNHIVSNLSPGREPEVPTKYRNNPIGASRLSSLWLSIGFFKTSNHNIKDVVHDPISNLQKITSDLYDNKLELVKLSHDNEFNLKEFITEIDNGAKGKYYEINQKDSKKVEGFERSFNAIKSCMNKETQRVFESERNKIHTTTGVALMTIVNSSIVHGLGDNPKEFIKNMLVATDNDFNIYKLNPDTRKNIDPSTGKLLEQFSPKKYFENKKPTYQMIFKMSDLLKDGKLNGNELDRVMNSAIKETCKMALQYRNIITPTEKKLFNKISKGIKPTHLELMQYSCEKFTLSQESEEKYFLHAAKTYAETKHAYESRSFLAKWFLPSVKKQKQIYEDLENKILGAGFDKDTFEDYVRDYDYDLVSDERIQNYERPDVVQEESIQFEFSNYEKNQKSKSIDKEQIKVKEDGAVKIEINEEEIVGPVSDGDIKKTVQTNNNLNKEVSVDHKDRQEQIELRGKLEDDIEKDIIKSDHNEMNQEESLEEVALKDIDSLNK